jgi:hypothetical protein
VGYGLGSTVIALVFSVLVVGVRVFRGFQKNNWVLASLVGPGITCLSLCCTIPSILTRFWA